MFVNSAHAVSRNWVDARFPHDSDARGAVPAQVIAKACDLPAENLLMGNVALRRYVQERTGYRKRHANRVIDDMGFMKHHKGVSVTDCTSVDVFLDVHLEQVKTIRLKGITKARKRRWTDVSGGG